MRKLNDPKRIAQCARIKDMIREVAADPAHKDDYYAKLYHHWKLSPTVPLSKIEAFEKRAGVELPENYVYYLTQVGAAARRRGRALMCSNRSGRAMTAFRASPNSSPG